MTGADVVRQVLAELAPGERAAVRQVRIRAKERPELEDRLRGASAEQLGYFFGVPRDVYTLEPATGEIVLFLENLRPLTPRRLRIAVGHEIMHALGYDEGEVEAMGYVLPGEETPCCSQQ